MKTLFLFKNFLNKIIRFGVSVPRFTGHCDIFLSFILFASCYIYLTRTFKLQTNGYICVCPPTLFIVVLLYGELEVSIARVHKRHP
jgi:hypothetical protein